MNEDAAINPRLVPLSAYGYRMEIPTRFGDNDMLGHANNVAYNRYIESVVTQFQMQEAGVDYVKNRIAPVVVETLCRFHRSLSYPETVQAGLRVGRLGSSSVTFLIGLFGADDHAVAAATGHFIHVYTDRDTETAVPMPADARAVYERFR